MVFQGFDVLSNSAAVLAYVASYVELLNDIRLFVPDSNAPGVGESIDTQLAGGGTSASEAFSIPTGSRIFPKLTFAVRATADFRSDPDPFRRMRCMPLARPDQARSGLVSWLVAFVVLSAWTAPRCVSRVAASGCA